eukprot:Sspe_Gene.45948::Locus_22827_Transcript_4_4_Confidence_0.500_Length_1431::g.45948::m.45948
MARAHVMVDRVPYPRPSGWSRPIGTPLLAVFTLLSLAVLLWRITGRRRRIERVHSPPPCEGVVCERFSPCLSRRSGGGYNSSYAFPAGTPDVVLGAVKRDGRRIQPIFDVDDTIKSSGNVNIFGIPLGGIDAQYSRGSLYPGVAQFAFELANSGLPPGEVPSPVAVLTARAKEFGSALKLTKHHVIVKAFEETGEANGVPLWGVGWDKECVLYGSVTEWVQAHKRGMRKFINFKEGLRCCAHPEIGGAERNAYVLVGDTGDMDLDCGTMMLNDFPEDVLAVFMHVVSPDDPEHIPIPRDTMVNGRPILYFRTYPGAARKAFLCGLISASAMMRVCEAADQELRFMEARHRDSKKWHDLVRDMELCGVLAMHHDSMTGVHDGPMLV